MSCADFGLLFGDTSGVRGDSVGWYWFIVFMMVLIDIIFIGRWDG